MSKQHLIELAAERLNAAQEGNRNASKYDFVKVKVWLGDDMAHYYVLSRFLISRMLTVTKVPHHKAIKASLAVKKHLVDNDILDITQAELETILFSIMRSQGFGEEFVDRYRMVNRFLQQKRPLIILICGTACTGKSTFAQQLASRLNLPNVLQTDILYELLRTGDMGALSSAPLWCRGGLTDEDLVSEFQKECRIIRQGLEGDLCKTIKDGKPIIIEGLHLDPGLYLDEFGRHGMVGLGGTASLELPADTAASVASGGAQHTQQSLYSETIPGMSLGASMDMSSSHPSSLLSEEGAAGESFRCIPEEPAAPDALQCPSHSIPAADAGHDHDELMVTRRSVSFSEAAASGLSYTAPAHFKQSPWRHLRPGGFLHRLLHRPGSANDARRQQIQRSSTQPAEAERTQQGSSMKRTSSLGQVTFILHQQGSHRALSPIPVMPGSEIVLPLEQDTLTAPASDQATQEAAGSAQIHVHAAAAGSDGSRSAGSPCMGPKAVGGSQANGSPVRGGGQGAAARAHEPPPAAGVHSAEDQGRIAHRTGIVWEGNALEASRHHTQVDLQEESAPHAANTMPPLASSSGRDPSQGPVFVPLVLCMDARDYEVVVQEWQAVQGCTAVEALGDKRHGASTAQAGQPDERDAAANFESSNAEVRGPQMAYSRDIGGKNAGPLTDSSAQDDGSGLMHRLQVLQQYLCAYGTVGVPVVSVNVGNFNETLDKLHDYLLQCIQMSL